MMQMVEPVAVSPSQILPAQGETGRNASTSPEAADLQGMDRFEASAQSVAFSHRLSFLDQQLRLEVNGRISYAARSLELDLQIETTQERIEYKGRQYQVGRVQVKLRLNAIDIQMSQDPFQEEGDPLEIALELAQALNRIAMQKGRKRISLVFSTPGVLSKLFAIDNGKLMLKIISLVRMIEMTSELIYKDDRDVDQYVVGIQDCVRQGVLRRLQVGAAGFSGELNVTTARDLEESGPGPATGAGKYSVAVKA